MSLTGVTEYAVWYARLDKRSCVCCINVRGLSSTYCTSEVMSQYVVREGC